MPTFLLKPWCYVLLQGPPGKTGARGLMGETGSKVHVLITEITEY